MHSTNKWTQKKKQSSKVTQVIVCLLRRLPVLSRQQHVKVNTDSSMLFYKNASWCLKRTLDASTFEYFWLGQAPADTLPCIPCKHTARKQQQHNAKNNIIAAPHTRIWVLDGLSWPIAHVSVFAVYSSCQWRGSAIWPWLRVSPRFRKGVGEVGDGDTDCGSLWGRSSFS